MTVRYKIFVLDNKYFHKETQELERLLNEGWRILRADTNHTENRYGTHANTVYILEKSMEWIGRNK